MNATQTKVLRAVLEAQVSVLQPTGYQDDLDQITQDVLGFLNDAASDAQVLVGLVLDTIADTSLGAFWNWDPARRQTWLRELSQAPLVGGKQTRDLLGVLLSLGWLVIYSRPAGRGLFWKTEKPPTDPATGKPALPVSVPQPPRPDLTGPFAVCVIGSGAGGAVVAARLAEAGVAPILIVEAGAWVEPKDYPSRDDFALRRCYASSGVQPALSSAIPISEFLEHGRVSTVNVLQGHVVGGGPAVNNAICLRIPAPQPAIPGPWAAWQAAGAPFGYDQLADAYQMLETELALDPLGVDQCCGWRSLLFKPNGNDWGRLVIAMKDCLGCGGCNTGCQFGRKLGGLGNPRSFLERARAAGALVAAQLQADHFQIQDGQVQALVLNDLANPGTSIHVQAKAFVLAAGPIGSTAVLQRSGLGLALPLGQRASANVVTPVYGVFPNPPDAPKDPGLQMCYYAGTEGELLRETWFHYPGSIAVSLPPWFQDHLARIQDYARLGCIGVVVPTGPHGNVGSDGRLYLALNDDEFVLMKQGLLQAAGDLFGAGATQVHLAAKEPVSFDAAHQPDLEALLEADLSDQGDLNLATAHPQGGNAISTDPAIAVVDAKFQVRGAQGLFVADASLFPAPCGVNPMLTTMALAHLAAAQVKTFVA
ncbi:MAG TPA: GMC oxidoreductase [Candidatus Acidoferrum sp.]|nr:GMC oxidoreductase [Candidatus Acidoferrum sp.]